MSQPHEPSGSPQGPWGPTPSSPQPEAGGYGQSGSGSQPAGGGYGAQPVGQQPGYGGGQPGYGGGQPQYASYPGQQQGQIPGYGGPGAPSGAPNGWQGPGPAAAPSTPGPLARVFDLSLTRLFSPDHLRGAMVLVLVVAIGVTVSKILDALFYFGPYATVGNVLVGILFVLLAFVWGLATLLVGRFAIELLIHVSALRTAGDERAEKQSASGERAAERGSGGSNEGRE